MKLDEKEAMDLLKNVAESECIFPSERNNVSRKVAAVDQTYNIGVVASKLDTLSQQIVIISRKVDGNSCFKTTNNHEGISLAEIEEVKYVGDRG